MSRKKVKTGFIKYLNDGEFKLLLDGLERWDYNFRCMFAIAYYVGLRRVEICRIKTADFKDDFRILRVKVAKAGKVIDRIVPEKLRLELISYWFCQKFFSTNEYFFQPSITSGSKKPHIQPSSLNWKFHISRKKAGLEDIYYIRKNGSPLYRVSFHTLRHSFLERFYKASGNDLVITSQTIGHTKTSTTVRYVASGKRKEREKLIVNMIC